ncbi:MAG: hypothetical protein CL694_12420 [Chloroflexi bacterium]|nr:hypothetical protein [Chloroflexota bacterium]
MNIGSTSINILQDGTYLLDGGILFGGIPKTEWELQVKPDRRNRVRLSMNTVLITTPETNILVDTGAGSKRSALLKEERGLNGNKLARNLRNYGMTPRDIDVVVLTQLFTGHSGGCTKLDRTGDAVPAFPKAKYLIQQDAWDSAHSPNGRYLNRFHEDDFLPLADREMVSFLEGDDEIIPGVTVKTANGPSAGHQVVLIERGSERIAFAGDLIPTPYHLPLACIPAADEFPNETLVQKRELIEMAMEDGWLIIFGHGNQCRSGYVRDRNSRAEFVPVEI